MHEYLIKAEDDDFLIPHRDALAQALHPAGYECDEQAGDGEYRMRCREVELAFYFEGPGIHVVAHGSDTPPDALVGAVAHQVAVALGRATFVVPL